MCSSRSPYTSAAPLYGLDNATSGAMYLQPQRNNEHVDAVDEKLGRQAHMSVESSRSENGGKRQIPQCHAKGKPSRYQCQIFHSSTCPVIRLADARPAIQLLLHSCDSWPIVYAS